MRQRPAGRGPGPPARPISPGIAPGGRPAPASRPAPRPQPRRRPQYRTPAATVLRRSCCLPPPCLCPGSQARVRQGRPGPEGLLQGRHAGQGGCWERGAVGPQPPAAASQSAARRWVPPLHAPLVAPRPNPRTPVRASVTAPPPPRSHRRRSWTPPRRRRRRASTMCRATPPSSGLWTARSPWTTTAAAPRAWRPCFLLLLACVGWAAAAWRLWCMQSPLCSLAVCAHRCPPTKPAVPRPPPLQRGDCALDQEAHRPRHRGGRRRGRAGGRPEGEQGGAVGPQEGACKRGMDGAQVLARGWMGGWLQEAASCAGPLPPSEHTPAFQPRPSDSAGGGPGLL